METSDKDKLEGVEFFLGELEASIRSVRENPPTKIVIIAMTQVWLNHINTIKGIIQ